MSLTTCIRKAGTYLSAADKATILEAARQNRKAGMSADEAGKAAVRAQLEAVQARIAELAPEPQVSTKTDEAPKTLKERAGAMAAKGQPVHQDPGEAPEMATKAVVSEAVAKAADNRDRKPSEMRAELLRMVDEAIPRATHEKRSQVPRSVTSRDDPTHYVRFKVPGDGTFLVMNATDALREFRANVEKSPGFRDRQARPGSERTGTTIERGSTSAESAIRNMIDDGDPQAAVDYAAARGINLEAMLKGEKTTRWIKVQNLKPTAEAVGEFEPEAAPEPAAPAQPAAASAAPPAQQAEPSAPAPAEPQAWHTPLPEQGEPSTDQDRTYPSNPKSEIDARKVVSRLAREAMDAITRVQMTNISVSGMTLYPWVLPAQGNRYGVVRLLPEDQQPGGDWQRVGTEPINVGGQRERAIDQLIARLGSAPVLATEKPSTLKQRADSMRRKPEGEAVPIADVGEKIGGARKDTAVSSGESRKKTDDKRPAWARRFQVAQEVTGIDERGEHTGPWVIRDNRNTDWMGNPKKVGSSFGTKEEAEAFLPIAAVGLKHRPIPTRDGKYEIWREITDRKRVKVVDQVFDTRDDAMRYMAENAVAIIETNTTFGEADMPLPPDRRRSGPERRQGNVTGQDFKDTFGFRGVEFGNWNNQDERQALMNDAWDGLMDLADVLGIPPKAIGLNGDLALAFGARGHGLQSARAHYELDRAVINLTKEKGAGSLAHEWFHALDHYFGRQDGKASAQWSVKADGTRELKVQGEAGDDMVSSGFTRNRSGVRPEVRAAYEALLQTMTKKAETYVEDTAKVDRFTGTAKEDLAGQLDEMRRELSEQKDVRYYKRNNKPATAEQLAAFDSIAKAMLDGDVASLTTDWRLLKTDKGKGATRWTNDALERLSEINKAVRGRNGFDADQKGRLDRLRSYMERYSQRLKMLAEAQSGTEKQRMVPTEFAMNAKELDQGRGGDYWTTPHEMAARAFQGYVEDKIAERGGTSRFLNYGPENAGILTPWGFKRPFPAGAERKAINAALDKLVGTLQTRTDDAGNVALFSRAAVPSGFVSPRDLRAEVAKITAGWDQDIADVQVVNRVEDLPADIRNAVRNVGSENTVRGLAMPDGRVYLVAENISTIDEGRFVLFHEVYGHVGMRAFLGDGYATQMKVLRSANPALAREADAWFKQYGETEIAARVASGFTEAKARADVEALAVEEALADRAGDAPAVKGWTLLLAALQRGLRRLGLGSVADMLEGMTEAETLSLLRSARETVQAWQRERGLGLAPAMSRDDDSGGIIRVRPMMLPSGPGWVVSKRDPNVGEMHLGYYRTEPEAREAAERERTEVRKGYGGRQSNRWWTPTPRTPIQSTGDGRLDSVGRDAAVRETLAARADSIKSAEQAEGLEQIADRVGWCFPCAAQASAAGLGDMVIGRATGISGNVWHAVVMRDGAIYDPTFGVWFEPGVYEALGFTAHTALSPQAVRDFIAKTSGMAPDARNLKLDLPSFSRRQDFTPPPEVATGTTDQGYPEFASGAVTIAFPQPAERFEVIPEPGQEVLSYAIMPPDSFDVLGHVELLVENGRPVSLLDIEVYADKGRSKGVGRAVIEALLAANPDADLNISNIVEDARGFWERMGVPQQNLEQGAAYEGTLNWQTYAENNRAAGRNTQGRGGARQAGNAEGAGAREGAAGQVGPVFSRGVGKATAQDMLHAKSDVYDFNRMGETRQDRARAVFDKARPFWLGALTRDQIADVYGAELPQVRQYDGLVRSMENERSSLAQRADDLYQEWAKLPAEMNDRLARIMLDATVEGVHPDRDDKPTDPGKVQAHALLRAKFKLLDKDAQAMYRKVRDFHSGVLVDIKTGLIERIKRQVAAGAERAALLSKVQVQFDQYLGSGPYFPLHRFGDYLVVATRPDGERVVASYENAGEQQVAARELRAQGFTTKLKTAKDYSRSLDGSAGKFIGDMIAAVDKVDMVEATINGSRTDLKNQLLDDLNQLFIRALPDLSYRKHFSHRKNTAGFSSDVMRGFASSAFHAASHIARLNHADKMTAALEDAYKAVDSATEGDFNTRSQVLNELAQRHDSMLNPSTHPLAALATQAGFVMYLGLSPAAGLINMLQVPMVSLPYIGARYGFRKASAALGTAYKDIMAAAPNRKSGFNAAQSPKLSTEERQAISTLQDEGVIDLTQAHDLASATDRDVGNVARSRASFAAARAMRIVGWTFHVPEVMNRQVTALMAYRLEREKGGSNEAALEAARDAIKRTQFDYSSSNRARYFQGNLARVVLQFKQFAQNMTYFLGRAAHQALKGEDPEVKRIARRQILSTFVVTGMMAGTMGMPGVGALGALVGALAGALGDDDEPWDWQAEYRNMLADAMGKEWGEVFAKGIPRMLMPAWDVSGRVGLSELWWRSNDREGQSARESFASDLGNILGPSAGTVLGWYTAADHMQRGQYDKAIESVVPKFIRDPLKAIREANEGITTYNGEPLMDTTFAEEFGRFLGFAPARASEMFEGRNAVMNAKTALEEKRQRLLTAVVTARLEGDADAEAEARAEIAGFNERNPDFKITGMSIAKSLATRRRNRENTVEGILLPDTKAALRERARFANLE